MKRAGGKSGELGWRVPPQRFCARVSETSGPGSRCVPEKEETAPLYKKGSSPNDDFLQTIRGG